VKFDRSLTLAVVLAMACVIFTGCVGRSPATPDAGMDLTSPAPRQPSFSLSMARNVNTQPAMPATVGDEDKAGDNASRYGETVGIEERGSSYSYLLQKGDPLVIHLRGIYPQDQEVEDMIDDNGNVTLPFLGDILAAGRPTSELESFIRDRYISGGYYRSITVSVVMPQRTYFIRGEVRAPGRFPVVGGLTMLQAIAAAGGYTEFANTKKVNLIRGGRTTTYNMRDIERRPEQDIRLESGDVIVVERSLF
jgi:protein involved in polysaccharide export with SLBB domain